MRKTIVGVTPQLDTRRGVEIGEWLACHPEYTNYVILDDDADMLGTQKFNFVHTDNVIGFTLYDMVKAMDILGVIDDPEKVKRADELRNIVTFKQNKRKEDDCDYTI